MDSTGRVAAYGWAIGSSFRPPVSLPVDVVAGCRRAGGDHALTAGARGTFGMRVKLPDDLKLAARYLRPNATLEVPAGHRAGHQEVELVDRQVQRLPNPVRRAGGIRPAMLVLQATRKRFLPSNSYQPTSSRPARKLRPSFVTTAPLTSRIR